MLLKTNIEERSGKTFLNENFIWFFKGKTLENMVNHEIPEEDFPEKQLNSFKKLESALFKIKFKTNEYSKVLILTLTIVFSNFVCKIPVWGKFGSKTQSALFRVKICTKRYSGVLIPNSRIGYLSFFPKIPFWGKFSPATSECFV